jgi:hypothetical protein
MPDIEVDLMGDFWAFGSIRRLRTENRSNRNYNERKRNTAEHCAAK